MNLEGTDVFEVPGELTPVGEVDGDARTGDFCHAPKADVGHPARERGEHTIDDHEHVLAGRRDPVRDGAFLLGHR